MELAVDRFGCFLSDAKMGSCENSVVVDEPLCASISGQHLCAELPRPLVDSKVDLAGAPNSCPDLVSNYDDSGSLSSGDGLVGKRKDVYGLGLESLLTDDYGRGGGCLDESRSGINVRETESDGECLREGSSVSRDGLVGEYEAVDVLPLEENRNVIDVRVKQSSGECLQEGDSVSNDEFGGEYEVVNVLGSDKLLENDSAVGGSCLDENCTGANVAEKESSQECWREGSSLSRDGSVGEYEAADVLPLENVMENDSGHSGGCLDESHNDIDVREKERDGECLQEGTSVTRDGSGDEDEPADVLGLDELLKNDFAFSGGCLDENHINVDVDEKESGGECLQEGSFVSRDGSPGEYEAVDVLPLENLLKKGAGVSGGCFDDNHNGIDVHEKVSGRECLQQGSYGDNGDGLVGEHKDLDVLELENSLINDSTVSGGCLDENQSDIVACIAESCGECLQEGTSRGEDNLGNLVVDCKIHPKVITVADLPANGVQLDEQKDEGVCCLFTEEIMEVREDKNDLLAKVSNDLCLQEPLSQDRESIESLPANDVLGNNLEQEEQNFDCVSDPSLGNITGKSVASVGSEADMCTEISDPFQCGEMSLDFSHSGEEVSHYACENYQNNSSGCLPIERVTEAVGMESNIDTSNLVSLSTSLENEHKLGSPMTCVQQYEQMDEKSGDSPSAKGVTEFVEEKIDVTVDTKVDVGDQLLALEENACNDASSSLRSCQPLGVVDDGSSKTLDLPDQPGNISHGPIKSGSTVDCYGKTDDEGNDNEGVNCVSEAKSCDIASSSQKNSRRSRSSRKTRTKNATRKCKKTEKVLSPNGLVKLTFKTRKKRSCLSKSARSSAWGLLGNVTQLFEHSNGLEVIQAPNQGSQKPKRGKRSGKKNKNGANIKSKSQGSRKNTSASNTKIRLKVKLGKGVNQTIVNVMVPKVVDNSTLPTAASCDDGTTASPKAVNGEVDDCKKCEVSMHFKCLSSNEEKATSCSDASVQDAQLVNNGLGTNVVTEKSAPDAGDDYFGIYSSLLVEASEGVAESRCKDPGTSPDSEVINLIPDAHDSRPHDDFQCTVTSPKDLAVPKDLTSNKSGKKKNKRSGLGNSTTEDKSPLAVRINKAKLLKQYGRKQNTKNGICSVDNLTFSTSAKASSNSSSDKEPSVVEPLLSPVETALGVSTEALKVETDAEAKKHSNLDNSISLPKSQKSKNFLPPPKAKGRKLPKGKSQCSDSGIKRVNSRSKKESQRSSAGKKKVNEKSVCDQVPCEVESQPEAENLLVDGEGKANSGENIASTNISNLNVSPAALGEQYLPPRNAWVRCDSCHKWRRIPAELADRIEETQCTWCCKDNMDKAFSDCSTPQEKSNADINAELEISDASGEEDASGSRLNYKGLGCRRLRDLRETPTCISIRTNQFLHRSRKTQTIDEIMVCHCKRPSDGQLGCGDNCLNRMLNIECVQSACPCGDLCSNQQFQKRKYAKLGKFQCGKKGYGLKLLEDTAQGKFLIEYVGEVLDMQAYEARQKEYALKGHKHFYFMTLNGSEVIDACIKGNKGRFINHSCDPNCRTEKWMVNGEICIGLFALRDIKKGEEVTFDYNYVRVFGAAAKKCYCGSSQCRGYIGGDPLNGDVIIQSDSDEDYPEPIMLPENVYAEESLNKIVRKPSSSIMKKTSESTSDHIHEKDKQTPAVVQSEISTGKEDSMNHSVSAVSQVHDALELDSNGILSSSVQPLEISQQTEDVTSELISTVRLESSMEEETMEKTPSSSESLDFTPPVKVHSKSLSDSFEVKRRSKSDTADDQRLSSKAHPKVKTSRPSSTVKKGKVKSSPPSTGKVQLAVNKLQVPPKKVIQGSFGNNFEAVEEKLNELLDADGGISKRKDATKGYLKLLLLTAASGDSANGEGIQRNRDLSMILDALLKTKSRVVLIDIINKNGLRMLHNIMKQYRRDFIKIPILRKLLKVLEFLAAREILTAEHINGGPPCPGMESFKASILSLTEHNDRQVHQIARNFRDRWIPKNLRKLGFVDRDDNKREFPRSSNCNRYSTKQNNRSDHYGRFSEASNSVKQSTPATTLVDEGIREGSSGSCAGVSPTSGTKTRKRKSRWDQPAEINSVLFSLPHKEQKIESKQFETTVHHRDKLNTEESNCPRSVNDCCQLDMANIAHEPKKNILEDVPPGFSSPIKPPLGSSAASSTAFHSQCPLDTVIGYPQEKFASRLPVSYGIPLSIMQQFGTPHTETAGSWVVAPGMPFHPFPPLPSYPRDKKDPSPSGEVNHLSVNQPAEEAQPDSRLPTTNSNDCAPSTTGDQPATDIPCTNNRYTSKRGRESSHDLGRKYFKQQKWNNAKLGPPWPLRRNGWGCMGNSRDGTSSVIIGNITNEHRSTYCSEDLSCTMEKASSNCFQHPEHHSQH